MSELQRVESSLFFNRRIKKDTTDDIDEKDGGWDFNNGDPEYWVLKDQLVKEGGKVFDFGIGVGRGSMFFALNGMEIEGCDVYEPHLDALDEISEKTGLAINGVLADARDIQLPEDTYDLVIVSGLILHLRSTEEALAIIDNAFRSLKAGGHIYIRTLSREDHDFENSQRRAELFPSIKVSDEVYLQGSLMAEEMLPLLFVDPTVFMQSLLHKDAKIVYSRLSPTKGDKNVMFGENWLPEAHEGKNGMITLVAQKSDSTDNPSPEA